MIYLKVFCYLFWRLGKRISKNAPFEKFNDALLGWFFFLNLWVVIFIVYPVFEYCNPHLLERLNENRLMNIPMASLVILMLIQYAIFLSRDQWKDWVPEVEAMPRPRRRQIAWQIIAVMGVAFLGSMVVAIL